MNIQLKLMTALIFAIPCGSLVAQGAEPVRFSRDVLPILADRCFHCHGPDGEHREAGLRLDQRASAVDEMGAVIPGDAEASELLARLTTADPDLQMPPPDSQRKPLTEAEVDLIRRWIDGGAEWGRHWAFERPTKPSIEQEGAAAIDALIERRLRREGLAFSPEADRRSLIRRVSLDLTGLPPTPEEVEAFIRDDAPDAYERLVARLLASKHYGERMAWPWLDAARYADTSGFQGDPYRTMWPWRDWVVDALNANMPFDQFTIEQLAGDLLPNATPEQRLATGFNRNHMHNGEGGRIAEETRIENVFDRTETTGTVWLGLTLECARCHDHKFDPTSNRDYFAFFDFFNQTTESGRGSGGTAVPPAMQYVRASDRERLETARSRVRGLEDRFLAPSTEADEAQAKWESELAAFVTSQWQALEPHAATSQFGATLTIADNAAITSSGERPEQDVYEVVVSSFVGDVTAIRLDALVDPESPAGSTGRDERGNFVLTEFELVVRRTGGDDLTEQPVKFQRASASREQGNLKAATAIDGKRDGGLGWAPSAHTHKEPSHAIFWTERPVNVADGDELVFRLRFESQHTHHTLSKFRLSTSQGSWPHAADMEVARLLEKHNATGDATVKAKMREHFRTHHWPPFAALATELQEAKAELAKLEREAAPTSVMVMDTRDKPRATHILVKGIYNNVTDETVTADVPGMLPPLPDKPGDEQYTRLDLARWIVAPENPLTARVIVNRYWQLFFGRGLVDTPSDFGLQGSQPSHPALLDWLAVEFMESGWDVKHMHRLIVTSRTYRQSAVTTPELLQRDPENRLLARAPRFRMPSWMIRDATLAAAGLLQRDLGGPPVKPYQPDGIWAEVTFGKIKYRQDTGDALYRRSLYSFWRRIVGPTVFFDASKRQSCQVKPNLTNTPLHALTTLNDVTYVESARVMAEKLVQTHPTAREQVTAAFLALVARPPEPTELDLLTRRLERTREHFRAAPAEAETLLQVGEMKRDESLDASHHAALTLVINTLMNLDEFLVKP